MTHKKRVLIKKAIMSINSWSKTIFYEINNILFAELLFIKKYRKR